jgi:hypothetical protein
MVCSEFHRSLEISSKGISFEAKDTEVGIKKNAFEIRTVYLTQAPVSVKVTDLCTGK